ncbi:MAG TPA: ParA family protein [Anaerolineales bacterium]|nr:ParA family protein [Anaerolineales bacterium]
MNRTYTFVNQKGGVGKTTTAINLGAYLAHLGKSVLLVDLDPQANATACLGIDKDAVQGGTYDTLIDQSPAAQFLLTNHRLRMSLLPASQALAGAEVELVHELARENRLKAAIEPLKSRFEYILIDCPPSLGLLTVNGLVAAGTGVIIPVQCEYLALEGLSQLTRTIERVRAALFPGLVIRGLVLTMYDARTNLAADVVREVRSHFGELAFETIIPRSVRLAEAPSYGQPISLYAPDSTGAQAYEKLAREVVAGDERAGEPIIKEIAGYGA